jgi:hypothetical protein
MDEEKGQQSYRSSQDDHCCLAFKKTLHDATAKVAYSPNCKVPVARHGGRLEAEVKWDGTRVWF